MAKFYKWKNINSNANGVCNELQKQAILKDAFLKNKIVFTEISQDETPFINPPESTKTEPKDE